MRRALIIALLVLIPGISLASTYGSNFLSGGSCTADAEAASHPCSKALDGTVTVAESWESGNTAFPHWWKYDLGAGVTKTAARLEIASYGDVNGSYIKDVTVQGSNDNSAWTLVATSSYANYTTDGNWNIFNYSTSGSATAYRYYRIWFANTWQAGNTDTVIDEVMLKECLTDCAPAGTSTPPAATSTTGTAEQKYTLVTLLVIAGLLGADFVRRLFAGKFGKKLPFA